MATSNDLRQKLQTALGRVYVLERELGGGAMSRVFVAREPALGRRIVVKVLPPEMAAAVSVERFRREIQLAASLLHPHIVPLLSAGEVHGVPYYTMPFVEGESLRARLARTTRLPVDEAVRLVAGVARALDYAHRRDIVHRDIKPANLLLHDGHALVTDFGIARAIDTAATGGVLTEVGVVLGTPAYMSPEQVTGERELDGRSDIYALGCVLYEMLTGTPPFKGPTAQSILLRHLSDPAPSVRATRPDIPDTVDQALATALVKDPLRRCPSAAEFAAMLERFQMSSIAVRGLPNPRLSVSAERPRPRFVAVLPFQNMSADSDNESGSPKTSSRSCRKSGT